MKEKFIFLTILMAVLLSACATTPRHQCASGEYWDESRGMCISQCPDDSVVDLDRAVDMAIECVKTNPHRFDQAFAILVSIAQQNPREDNGERILRFINEVAIKAPFVSTKKAKMRWNRYFSPYLFVSVSYNYDSIKNCCSQKEKIKREIDEELTHKKIGLLSCMAVSTNKDLINEQYKQAEQIAASLKIGIDAACKSCYKDCGIRLR